MLKISLCIAIISILAILYKFSSHTVEIEATKKEIPLVLILCQGKYVLLFHYLYSKFMRTLACIYI